MFWIDESFLIWVLLVASIERNKIKNNMENHESLEALQIKRNIHFWRITPHHRSRIFICFNWNFKRFDENIIL